MGQLSLPQPPEGRSMAKDERAGLVQGDQRPRWAWPSGRRSVQPGWRFRHRLEGRGSVTALDFVGVGVGGIK